MLDAYNTAPANQDPSVLNQDLAYDKGKEKGKDKSPLQAKAPAPQPLQLEQILQTIESYAGNPAAIFQIVTEGMQAGVISAGDVRIIEAFLQGGLSGRPIAPSAHASLSHTGAPLAQVKINEQLPVFMQAAGAQGAAFGDTVVVRPGAIDEASGKGLPLLGHELKHVADHIASGTPNAIHFDNGTSPGEQGAKDAEDQVKQEQSKDASAEVIETAQADDKDALDPFYTKEVNEAEANKKFDDALKTLQESELKEKLNADRVSLLTNLDTRKSHVAFHPSHVDFWAWADNGRPPAAAWFAKDKEKERKPLYPTSTKDGDLVSAGEYIPTKDEIHLVAGGAKESFIHEILHFISFNSTRRGDADGMKKLTFNDPKFKLISLEGGVPTNKIDMEEAITIYYTAVAMGYKGKTEDFINMVMCNYPGADPDGEGPMKNLCPALDDYVQYLRQLLSYIDQCVSVSGAGCITEEVIANYYFDYSIKSKDDLSDAFSSQCKLNAEDATANAACDTDNGLKLTDWTHGRTQLSLAPDAVSDLSSEFKDKKMRDEIKLIIQRDGKHSKFLIFFSRLQRSDKNSELITEYQPDASILTKYNLDEGVSVDSIIDDKQLRSVFLKWLSKKNPDDYKEIILIIQGGGNE